MKRTLKTTIAALSLLLITSLVNVNEVRAEEVKKANSSLPANKEQNKQVPTKYKSELVNKIIKKYKLDPKNNTKDQCILIDAIRTFFELAESSEEEKQRFSEVVKVQKEMGILEIKESCDKKGNCSINNDIVMKIFDVRNDPPMTLFFDKSGNPIGYFYNMIGNENSIEYQTEMYGREYFYFLNKDILNFTDKINSNIDLITKGCYITYISNKLLPSN